MFARLALLFVVVPLVELVFLVLLSEATSLPFTIVMVLASGMIGAYLTKQQGFAAWRAIRDDLSHGRMPTGPALDGVLILVASVLLLTPGVLTDVVALSLLLPPVRARYKGWLVQWMKSRFRIESFLPPGNAARRSDVIDSYAVDAAGEKQEPNGAGQR